MADNKRTCSIPTCERAIKVKSRGWCGMHYQRWYKTGDPTATRPQWPSGTERFWSKVEKTDTCWNWTGTPSDTGYGHIIFEGKDQGVHRISWEIHRGPISDGMHIDHRCFNPICVRPDHLRLATNKQNAENHQGATRASKTGVRGVVKTGPGKYIVQARTAAGRYHGTYASLEQAESVAIAVRNKAHTHNDRDRIAA